MATSTASESQPQDPLLGKAVGNRYAIERLIGRGGVGLVYLAEDKIDGSQVVVKVLAPHWAEDRDAVARFDREALRMAKLDHPNVVKMYDHGTFEGRAYIVMEFIRGEPLRRYLSRRKRLPLEEFVPLAVQILDGAGYVHDRGIMMRDIKPPNIMLCEQGGKANHIKLLDFGLAKLIEEDEDDEVTKAHVIGTAAYMSPEQIKGERIDVRVDVYALGVLFFLMLTGEQPIAGDNDAAVLVNHVHGTPKPLAERLPQGHRIGPELIALVESCLAKSPADRPTDAGAMAKRLREIVPAPLLQLPSANLKTRAAAESYWAARLNSGPAAVAALESDGNDSAEWTRPLLRRAAKTGESPLKLAEAEIAAQRQKQGLQAVGSAAPPKARTTPGSGAMPRPQPSTTPGSGAMPRPKPPAPPGAATSGSGALARPKPPAPPPPPPRRTTGSSSAVAPNPLTSPPGSATIRVTAADAKEAVAKLEEQLEASRSGMRTLIPTGAPASGGGPASAGAPPTPSSVTERHDPLGDRPTLVPTKAPAAASASAAAEEADAASSDRRTLIPTKAPGEPVQSVSGPRRSLPARDDAVSEMAKTGRRSSVPPLDPAELDPDAEDSDVLPIALDDDDDVGSRRSEAIAPTVPSDPMATDALSVVKPMPVASQPSRGGDGMRWGAIVAVAGLVALSLGGLSAYLVLDDDEPPSSPSTPTAPAEAKPAATDPKAPAAPAGTSAEGATSGKVEIRAIAGARVEVDGEDRGEAPLPLELSLGDHRIKVTAPGHYPWQTTIDVKAGANAAVTAELVPVEGTAAPPEPKTPGDAKRPKPGSGSGKPKPDAKPDDKPKDDTKAKPDVFLDSSKGKDDGIFLPVGGK